jgi:hypothetical protein
MSNFIAYEGSGRSGRSQVINVCGVTNIDLHGSYQWFGFGQDGRMYNVLDARGPAVHVLHSDQFAGQDTAFGWLSINIVC